MFGFTEKKKKRKKKKRFFLFFLFSFLLKTNGNSCWGAASLVPTVSIETMLHNNRQTQSLGAPDRRGLGAVGLMDLSTDVCEFAKHLECI